MKRLHLSPQHLSSSYNCIHRSTKEPDLRQHKTGKHNMGAFIKLPASSEFTTVKMSLRKYRLYEVVDSDEANFYYCLGMRIPTDESRAYADASAGRRKDETV